MKLLIIHNLLTRSSCSMDGPLPSFSLQATTQQIVAFNDTQLPIEFFLIQIFTQITEKYYEILKLQNQVIFACWLNEILFSSSGQTKYTNFACPLDASVGEIKEFRLAIGRNQISSSGQMKMHDLTIYYCFCLALHVKIYISSNGQTK